MWEKSPREKLVNLRFALALPQPAVWPWATHFTSLGLFPYPSSEYLDYWTSKDLSSSSFMVVEFDLSPRFYFHLFEIFER